MDLTHKIGFTALHRTRASLIHHYATVGLLSKKSSGWSHITIFSVNKRKKKLLVLLNMKYIERGGTLTCVMVHRYNGKKMSCNSFN